MKMCSIQNKNINTEISKSFNAYTEEILSFKEQVRLSEEKVLDVNQEYANTKSLIAEVSKQLLDLSQDYLKYKHITDRLNWESVQINEYMNDITKIREDISRVRNGLSDLNWNLMTTDNYLDKYLPFRIQNLISETLDSVLDDFQLKRLSQFETKKFKRMHDEILNDAGASSLDKTYEGVYKYENRGSFILIIF